MDRPVGAPTRSEIEHAADLIVKYRKLERDKSLINAAKHEVNRRDMEADEADRTQSVRRSGEHNVVMGGERPATI